MSFLKDKIPQNTALCAVIVSCKAEAKICSDNTTFLLYFLQFEECFLETKDDLTKLQKGKFPSLFND